MLAAASVMPSAQLRWRSRRVRASLRVSAFSDLTRRRSFLTSLPFFSPIALAMAPFSRESVS